MFLKLMYSLNSLILVSILMYNSICESESLNHDEENSVNKETELIYTSYKNLVMAGYQGWFNAKGDDTDRGWYHYQHRSCGFYPGCSSIDMWPDMEEYEIKYATPFQHEDGSRAYLFSSNDEESVDLHFRWMKKYGIDGVFMQRFVVEIKRPEGKNHFDKVLENALKAARKYERAISIMYDLSGSSSSDLALVEEDWKQLQTKYSLYDHKQNPSYIWHNGKPLMAIWGIGFDDGRSYSVSDVGRLVANLKEMENRVSIMLGVPYFWRTFGNDTVNDEILHSVIRQSDVIMPWAVGRYGNDNYDEIAGTILRGDIEWTQKNNIDYVPLIFPGFSWGNLQENSSLYNQIPRDRGDFFWKQVAGAKMAGAQSLYVAMFDEIDEGTAIFKLTRNNEVPFNGDKKFIGIDNDLDSDYYLWLTGQATRWFHGEKDFHFTKPERSSH